MTRVIADGVELPEDPVGSAVAEILVDLLDGLVVELSYARPPDVQHTWLYHEPAQTAVAERAGPGPWETTMIVNVAGGAAGLCASEEIGRALPGELSSLPTDAFRAADEIALQSGIDGNVITAPLQRALQESIVIEILGAGLARLSKGALHPIDARGLLTSVLHALDRVASMTVERQVVSHGLVLRPTISDEGTGHRYPDDYQQKRVPLLFDGRNAVLVVDAAGHVEFEVQRSRPDRRLPHPNAVDIFTEQLGEQGGSLVAATSRAFEALGFYVHPDHSIWVYTSGSPMLVRRGGRWHAIPMDALRRGVALVCGSDVAAGKAVATAVLLSLHGHGGIIGIVEDAEALDGCVQDKDRVDTIMAGAPEAAVHLALDLDDIDIANLVRLASIDGALVLDGEGRVVAYGAIVTSSDSVAEGARTAAARALSRQATIVLKVSEDGPISVFHEGELVGDFLS